MIRNSDAHVWPLECDLSTLRREIGELPQSDHINTDFLIADRLPDARYGHVRWYDSTTGRFLSEDPSGIDGGDTNLYRYVANGPTNATDPSGLAERPNQTRGRNITWLDPTWYSKPRRDGRVIGFYVSNPGTWYKLWSDREGKTVEWVNNELVELDSHPPDTREPIRVSRADALTLSTMGMPIAMTYNAGRAAAYEVGSYNVLRANARAGLDAHHVGQKAVMPRFIPGYDAQTAPAILLPKVGHTVRGARGLVSRSASGLNSARSVIARDIRELRRVYPDIPNTRLQELIDLNRRMYPQIGTKP